MEILAFSSSLIIRWLKQVQRSHRAAGAVSHLQLDASPCVFRLHAADSVEVEGREPAALQGLCESAGHRFGLCRRIGDENKMRKPGGESHKTAPGAGRFVDVGRKHHSVPLM